MTNTYVLKRRQTLETVLHIVDYLSYHLCKDHKAECYLEQDKSPTIRAYYHPKITDKSSYPVQVEPVFIKDNPLRETQQASERG